MTNAQAKAARAGTRVVFDPNAASALCYNYATPPRGTHGKVASMPFGGGVRKTYLPGPGGGLLYVEWENGQFCGVASGDVEKAK